MISVYLDTIPLILPQRFQYSFTGQIIPLAATYCPAPLRFSPGAVLFEFTESESAAADRVYIPLPVRSPGGYSLQWFRFVLRYPKAVPYHIGL